MQLLAELVPPRDPKALLGIARKLVDFYDWIDIPDAPLGKPNYSSPIAATFLAAHGFPVIAHLRVIDVNIIALKTITKTMGSLGVKRIVYLRGDPPQQGEPVYQVTPEEAVRYALSRPEAPEPGLLLSLRKPLPAIEERLESGARFYLVLNYTPDPSRLEKLERIIQLGAQAYIYYILDERGEREVRDGRVPGSLQLILDTLPSGAAGLLVSYPKSMETVLRLGRLLRSRWSI